MQNYSSSMISMPMLTGIVQYNYCVWRQGWKQLIVKPFFKTGGIPITWRSFLWSKYPFTTCDMPILAISLHMILTGDPAIFATCTQHNKTFSLSRWLDTDMYVKSSFKNTEFNSKLPNLTGTPIVPPWQVLSVSSQALSFHHEQCTTFYLGKQQVFTQHDFVMFFIGSCNAHGQFVAAHNIF